jgi:Cof subfamily protein (haloacid dehalogenase superfamily)
VPAAPSPDVPVGLRPGGRRDAWAPGGPPALVLLDVDGTLVGAGHVVTAPVVAAVRAAAAAGVAVGLATGRNLAGVAGVLRQLGTDGPHVVLNGAQVRLGGGAARTWPLTAAQRTALLDLCERRGLYAELYTGEALLVTAMDRTYQPHWELIVGWPVGTVADRPDLLDEVVKATVVTRSDHETAAVLDAVAALGLTAGPATSPATPGFTYVNITAPEADKGRAVVAAAELLGVGADRVVAVGDAANDLPMLAAAGTAIAMADAPPAVLAAAHHVVPAVAEDGVAVALDAVRRWRADGL